MFLLLLASANDMIAKPTESLIESIDTYILQK